MRVFSVVVFIILALTVFSRGVRHINVGDGLPSRQVYELAEDSDGYIWIYTNAGLSRFDGHNARHYSLDASRESNDHIQWATKMRCDSTGALWVAQMPGVYRYDASSDRFIRQYVFSDPEIQIYNFALAPDSIVVVCTNKGLYGFTPGSGPRRLALADNLVSAIISDGHGAYYAGTQAGVYSVNPAAGFRAEPIRGTSRLYVKSLATASGKLFIGTFSSGVYEVNPATCSVSRLGIDIPPLPVNALQRIGTDSLLIGVDGAGVYLVDSKRGTLVSHYTDDDTDEPSLSGNTVTDVHVDRENGLWIATSHRGITYIPMLKHPGVAFHSKRGDRSSLLSDYANAVFEDSDGDLWIGTDKGLSRLVKATGRWQNYLNAKGYVDKVILSVNEDSSGRIWVGSYGDGVSVVDKASGRVEPMPQRSPGDTTGVATECVFATACDHSGDIWMGGINGDITRYTPSTGRYRYYNEDCISTIVADTDGSLIFGGNLGVGRYDSITDRFEWTTSFDSVSIRYPVRCLAVTPGDTLWIGTTGDGLIRYARKTGDVRRYTVADGLSANTIYSLVRDRSGYIWACTETDLYRIDPDRDKITRLTYYLGTDRGAFNPCAAMLKSDGGVLLGSADGCIVFYPQVEISDVRGRRILFTDFRVNDKAVKVGEEDSPLQTAINLSKRINLKSSQNSFEIGFDVINNTAPSRIGYEYRLAGYDEDFVKAAGYSAKYRDLPYGKYKLTVRAIDMYTDRVVDTRDIEVCVAPPLWLSWWAKLIYLVIFGAVAALVVSYFNQYRREKRIEEQLQSFAAVAHDIRTPISLIKNPLLNIELEKELSQRVRDNLRQARVGIDKAMDMLSEMLELRGEANMRTRLQVEPLDIREFLQVKAEEYDMLAKFKGLMIEVDVPTDMPTVLADRNILGHIIDNLLSNALKYTEHGAVKLSATPGNGKRWELIVSDTGMGIPPADVKFIFRHCYRSAEAVATERSGMGIGLLITRRLVASHQGKIEFESREGAGTTFRISLPYSYPDKYRCAAMPSASVGPGAGDAADDIAVDDAGRPRIMIVEDDSDMLDYLRKSLEPEYEVLAFSDSLAAFDAIRGENPDLVITDRIMQKLTGDELCRMIKTDMATSHVPVILLSGLASREDIISGYEAHADDYIVKPFDIVLLKARIRNIMKSRAEMNRRVMSDVGEADREDFTNELDREFMTKVMASVEAHLADSEFSIADLCSDLGMSRTSVYNKIKSLTGQSLTEFIRIMRLNRSKELLLSRRYNISEVAYMVGFSDPKYFSTCFKKQFGISPSKL